MQPCRHPCLALAAALVAALAAALALALVATLGLGLVARAVPVAAAASPPSGGCPTYELVGARGSGDAIAKDRGLGAPGVRFADALHALLPDVTIQEHPVNYAAVAVVPSLKEAAKALLVPWDLKAKWRAIADALNGVGAGTKLSGLRLGAYHDSVVTGKKLVRAELDRIVTQCPTQTLAILTGFSQGAQVAGDVYADLPSAERARVVALVLFGDPYYNPGSFAAQAKRDHPGMLGTRREFPQDARGHALSFCLARDPVCQGWTQIIHGFGAHTDGYQQPNSLAAAAAGTVAGLLEAATPAGSGNKKPASTWPTGRNDGTIAFNMYLGASLMLPSWVSCDPVYCLAGANGRVYVYGVDNGIKEYGSVPDTADPRRTLIAAGMSIDHVDALLAPTRS